MVGNDSDDEATNDLFDELLNEVKKDKQKKIEGKKEKAQPIKQANEEVSDIDNMLANLWFIYFIPTNSITLPSYEGDQNLSSIL